MEIELEVLSTIHGHNTIYLEEGSPEKRAEFAKTVQKLLRDGHAVFLMQPDETTRRIKEYDPETNEWIVCGASPRSARTERVPAQKTRAAAVAPVAGG